MELIEIRDIHNEQATKLFHQVPKKVYQDDTVWVTESEILFTQRFLESQTKKVVSMVPIVCLDEGRPVARCVAIHNPNAFDETGQPQGWIGFFECMEEYPQAAQFVIKRCEEILHQMGAKSIQIPKVDNQLVGLLTKGFDLPQTVYTNHNPPYYLNLLNECGYDVKEKIYTVYFTRETASQQVQVEIPGFTTREFDRNRLSEEITTFHKLQKEIFENRPGYIPRSLDEDRELVESFLPFLQDDLVIIAEDDENNPIGLLVCLPDMYQVMRGQEISRARIISIGAIPSMTHKGIGALMGAHLMKNLLNNKNYTFLEGSWILGSNIPPRNLAKRFSAEQGREFALLEKRL